MPKQLPFSDINDVDEDEKTTIESGWEEEPSTTVEQSEVADKVALLARRGPVTGVTSTSVGAEEATVDDRDGNFNAILSAVTPIAAPARVVITQGNETGVELEIRPGKAYTIGRGVDNDIVLTDIAVSRKHFDLRFEQGQWLIVDRGSGNGTLVNGNLEDQPFALASGDAIEIGNTSFRFEVAGAAVMPPTRPVQRTMDVDVGMGDDEEDEPSTVAGKPLRPEPEPMPQAPPISRRMTERPKTLPPPTPMRSRPQSIAPMPPPPTQPPPMYATQPPRVRPATAMGNEAQLAPIPALPHVMPTTLPGQGMPMPPHQSHQHAQSPLGSYPGYQYQSQEMPVPYQVHPGQSSREAPATALVSPTPYNGMPASYGQPTSQALSLSRRTKMIMGGVGLTAFAAILTVAIVRSGGGPAQPPPPADKPPIAMQAQQPTVKPIEQPTVKPIETPALKKAVNEPPQTTLPQKTVVETPPPKKVVVETPPPQQQKAVVETPPPKKVVVETPPPKKVEPPPQKRQPEVVVRHDPPPPPPQKRVEPPPSRGSDLSGVKSKASGQFANKQFTAAIATLKGGAGGASAEDAKELNQLARIYDQFARSYNVGMAPGTSPTDAYSALVKARNLDQSGAFKGEIEGRLGEVATRAATSYMGKGQYVEAATAVHTAESFGAGNSTTKSVRGSLESKAGDLYQAAAKEMPAESAKEKLKTVTKMVEQKSQWYQKATKLLASS